MSSVKLMIAIFNNLVVWKELVALMRLMTMIFNRLAVRNELMVLVRLMTRIIRLTSLPEGNKER